VIRSFANRNTEDAWNRRHLRAFGPDLQKQAFTKLRILNAAVTIGDCDTPPGNRLELLKGDRAGQHSIRINDQYRICFVWTDKGPTNVEIVDYH